MKKLFSISLFLLTAANLSAQDWYTNYEDAQKQASTSQKQIVLVFQGSDWCAPCMKLDKQVWATDEFQHLSKDSFIMLKADFPRRKANKLTDELQAHNNKLADLYNIQGYFPLVVVLDSKGKVLGKMGYEKLSPKDYYNRLMAFK